MEIIKVKSYDELSRKAADLIAAQILMKPDCVLGLATGSTPIGAYQCLVEKCARGDLDFSRVTTFNLDEYVGLAPEHEQSYHYFMHDNLFDHVNLRPDAYHVPEGNAADLADACRAYGEAITAAGGIDLQLLGIGCNGHIAFNEPADSFVQDTHIVSLQENTIEANKRFFASADEVPRQAITMGIRQIMLARRILLVADGANKREAVEQAFFGPVTPQVPASVLQLHPNVTVICHLED